MDLARKDYLDSTEVGAINYWLGMILTTVLGKKSSYEYMVHLSMVLKSQFTAAHRKILNFFFRNNGVKLHTNHWICNSNEQFKGFLWCF